MSWRLYRCSEQFAADGLRAYGAAVAGDRVTDLIPFVHVADVPRSVAFYELLGFETTDRFEPGGELVWAAVANGHARLMLAKADAPVDPGEQAVLFYLYTRDLEGLRERLVANGVDAGPIVDGSPGPERELRVDDPDGYCLMIAQTEENALWVGPG